MNIDSVLIFHLILMSYSYLIIPFTKKPAQSIENYLFPKLLTELSFGTPMQSFTICINVDSPYTWLIDSQQLYRESHNKSLKTFNSEASSSFVKVSNDQSMIWEDQMIFGKRVSDKIIFNSKASIDSLEFFQVTEYRDMKDCDGILGLQYNKKRHEIFTIIYQLFLRDLIERNQFSFEYTNEFQGKVIIGNNVPLLINYNNVVKMTNKEEQKIIQCDVIQDDLIASWYCRTKQITMLSNQYDKYGLVYINPSFGMIVGPYQFKKVITNKILKNSIINGDCSEEVYTHARNPSSFDDYYSSKNYIYFLCKIQADITIQEDFRLSFYFDEKKNSSNHLDITSEDLFHQINSTHKMLTILVNQEAFSIKLISWIIGEHILKKYNVVFRNDQNIIQFLDPKLKKPKSYLKKVVIGTMVIFIIMILALFYLIKRKSALNNKSAFINYRVDTFNMTS